MFQTEKPRAKAPKHKKPIAELSKMDDVKNLWLRPKSQQLFTKIETACAWDKDNYDTYYLPVLKRLLEYVESLPDSTNRFYSEQHGFFDYALLRSEAALSLFTDYLIVDKNADLSEEQRCWQYALFTASMLLGIGKLFLDYEIDLYDDLGGHIERWNPLIKKLINKTPYYLAKIEHNPSEVELRKRLNLILAKNIMPPLGFEWLASNKEIFTVWITLLNEDLQGVKLFGSILSRAEDMAVVKAIEEWLERQGYNTKAKGIRTFKDINVETPKNMADQMGAAFLEWVREKSALGEIAFNEKEGQLDLGRKGISINPELFKLFIRDFPTYKSWQAVQKGFMALGLTDESGIDVTELSFAKFGILLPAKACFYNKTTKSKAWVNAVELKEFVFQGKDLVAGKSIESQFHLPQVNAKGHLQIIEDNVKFINPGQHFRG